MSKLLRFFLVACTAVVLLAATGSPASAADPGLESQFVAGVNAARTAAGLPPLTVNGQLTSVARSWADQQAAANDIWHNPNIGGQVSGNWTLVGENVGTGPEVAGIMAAFINSPSHYANIVEPRFDYIGVGVTWGTDGRMYTTHVFMDLEAPASAPAPAPTTTPAPATTAPPATTTTVPPAPAPPPPPAPTPPPPAAAAAERVAVVLDMVGAMGDGVR